MEEMRCDEVAGQEMKIRKGKGNKETGGERWIISE